MLCIREGVHVRPDLGDDADGGDAAHAGYGHQGSDNRLMRLGEEIEGIDGPADHGIQVVEVAIGQLHLDGLLIPEVHALERLPNLLFLLLQALLEIQSAGLRIEVPAGSQYRIHERPGALAEGIRDDVVYPYRRDGHAVLDPVLLAGPDTNELVAVAEDLTHRPDGCGRDEGARDEVVLEEVGNPLGVFAVRLLAPNCLGVLGVGEGKSDLLLEDGPDRDPVLAGRLHAGDGTILGDEPVPEPDEVRMHGRELPLGVGRYPVGTSPCDGGDDELLVDVHSTADRMYDFHGGHYLLL